MDDFEMLGFPRQKFDIRTAAQFLKAIAACHSRPGADLLECLAHYFCCHQH